MPALHHKADSIRKAESLLAAVRRDQEQLVAELPTNYDFLRNLHRNGTH
jgi:hypothetical protein